MGFSLQERVNLNSKVLAAGVKDANEIGQWYESFFPNKFVLTSDKVWSAPDFNTLIGSPAPNLAAAQAFAAANPTIVEDYSDVADAIRLTEVPGSGGSTYVAFSIYGDLTSVRHENWVQPQFVPRTDGAFAGYPSIGYTVRLFDGDPNGGGTEIFTSDGQTGSGASASVGWVFDYANGMLLLSSDFRSTVTDPYILGFKYIGTTLADSVATSFDIIQESYTVTSNGQTALALSTAPLDGNYVQMFVDGLKQQYGVDYTVSGTSVTYSGIAPLSTFSDVEFWYIIPVGSLSASIEQEQITIYIDVDGQTIILLPSTPFDADTVHMFVNGQKKQYGSDYVVSGLTVSYTGSPDLTTTDIVEFWYIKDASGALQASLSQTLSFGNTTDGYDIILTGGSVIRSTDGDVTIDDNLYVTGKLTVDGLIDPTGLVLNEQLSSPNTNNPNEGVIWVRNDGYLIFTDQLNLDHVIDLDGNSGSGSSNLTEPTPEQDGYLAIASNGDLEYIGGYQNGYILTWNAINNIWEPQSPNYTLKQILYFDNITDGYDLIISSGDKIIIDSTGDNPPNGIESLLGKDLSIGVESGAGEGGDIRIYSGNSSDDFAGYLYLGAGDGFNGGGYVYITGGDALGTSVDGGIINITGGSGHDDGGHVNITGGNSGTVGADNVGGRVNLTGGQGHEFGGDIEIKGGAGTAGDGGYVELSAGEGTVQGGNVEIAAALGGVSNGIIRFRTDATGSDWTTGVTKMVIASSVINITTDVNMTSGNLNVTGDGYFSGDLHIANKLTVDGIIDPTALVLTEQSSAPYSPTLTEGMIWVRDDGYLMFTDQANTDHTIDIDGVGGGGSGSLSPVITEYRFSDNTTAADPGAGRFRLNNADPALATELYFSSENNNGADLTNIIGLISSGIGLYIQESNDATTFIVATVSSAAVDNTGWFTVAISVSDNNGTFSNNQVCGLAFFSGGSSSSNLTEPTPDQDGYVALALGGDLEYVHGIQDGYVLTWNSTDSTWESRRPNSTTVSDYSGVTTTTSDTAKLLIQLDTQENDTVYSVRAEVMAIGADGYTDGYAAMYEIRGSFKRIDDVVSQIGSTLVVQNNEDLDWGGSTFGILGTNIQVLVTGDTDRTINWEGFMNVRTAFGSSSDSPAAPVPGGAPITTSNLVYDLGPAGIPGSDPGDPVTTWTATVGPDMNVLSGTFTRSSINGVVAVDASGATPYMNTTGFVGVADNGSNITEDFTIYQVGLWSPTSDMFFATDSGGSAIAMFSSSSTVRITLNNGAVTLDHGTVGTITPFIWMFRYNQSTNNCESEFYFDGGTVLSQSSTTNLFDINELYIGSPFGNLSLSSEVGRLLVYNTRHDDSTVASQISSLASSWGITL